MTLENLWRRQLAFTSEALPTTYGKKMEELTEDDRIELTKIYVLSLHSELDEVLNNVPWKAHRFIGNANRENLLEELVDVQKFLFGLMQVWGATPSEIERAFNRKSDVVEQRFYQDHVLPSLLMNDKVAIVDIDDVVANWEYGFIDWVDQSVPGLSLDDYAKDKNPGYRELLKNKMHEEGGMLTLPPIQGAQEAISMLKTEGYTIVWLTARPVSKHPRLRADTVEWLARNRLPSDYIYYSDLNKHLFVVEKFPRAAVLFDDKPEIVSRAKDVGLEAYLIDDEDQDLYNAVCEFLKVDEF